MKFKELDISRHNHQYSSMENEDDWIVIDKNHSNIALMNDPKTNQSLTTSSMRATCLAISWSNNVMTIDEI